MEATRVFDLLAQLKSKYSKSDILAAKENKEWRRYSTDEFIEFVHKVSAGLMKRGINHGDKIAIISNNRPEWNFVDYGCQQIGAITVPIYPTISVKDLLFILNDAGVKIIFFSSKDILSKIEQVRSQVPTLNELVSFNALPATTAFSSFINESLTDDILNKIRSRSKDVKPDELFTLLYTSGTTGVPKGVMLSHINILSNVKAARNLAPFSSDWKALSFLPLNHVYERMVNTLYLYEGISIYYAEGLETISDNLKEIKPQVFVTVPRLLERVYEKLITAGEKLSPLKRKLFFWALDLSLQYDIKGKSFFYNLKRKIADRLIFSKWRAALGGNIVAVVSGGAALQPRLARVFLCAKITVLEAYGLTETSPAISANNFEPDSICIGTVGPVLKNTQVKIAEDGEILVKGPGVMMGYYNNEEATREVLTEEGWFHTGDIGTLVEGRFLKITDRKKEIFKNSAGKYVAPLMIENHLKECRFIEQCMVIGEKQKFASALLVPAFDYIKEWSKHHGVDYSSNEQIIQNESLRKEISSFVREMNKLLAPHEQIKRPELISSLWTVEGGELTPKMSLRRKAIMEKYADQISKIYISEEE